MSPFDDCATLFSTEVHSFDQFGAENNMLDET